MRWELEITEISFSSSSFVNDAEEWWSMIFDCSRQRDGPKIIVPPHVNLGCQRLIRHVYFFGMFYVLMVTRRVGRTRNLNYTVFLIDADRSAGSQVVTSYSTIMFFITTFFPTPRSDDCSDRNATGVQFVERWCWLLSNDVTRKRGVGRRTHKSSIIRENLFWMRELESRVQLREPTERVTPRIP